MHALCSRVVLGRSAGPALRVDSRLLSSTPALSSLWQRATAAGDTMPQKPCSVYLSDSRNPWWNLALEEWFIRNADLSQRQLLFMYRNVPSVVVGRSQNPWKECSPRYLEEQQICLLRRKSGGGTVYHDENNLNISFISSRADFAKERSSRLLARALQSHLSIPVQVSPRYDLLLFEKKISASDLPLTHIFLSGSAYRLASKNAYHHCTLLVASDLAKLRQSLQNRTPDLECKSIESVRSPVISLHSAGFLCSMDAVIAALSQEYAACTGNAESAHAGVQLVSPNNEVHYPNVTQYYEELKSWEWCFGQNPPFVHRMKEDFLWGNVSIQIHSRDGRIGPFNIAIESAQIDNPQAVAETLAALFENVEYDHKAIRSALDKFTETDAFASQSLEAQYFLQELCERVHGNIR